MIAVPINKMGRFCVPMIEFTIHMTKMLLYLALLVALYSSCDAQSKIVEVLSANTIEVDQPYDASIEVFTNDDGQVFANFRENYDYEIDEHYKLQIDIYFWKDDNWKYFYEVDDVWCKSVNQFKHPWEMVRDKIQPSLPDGCVIPEGEHVVENYRLTNDDISGYLAPAEVGKYMVESYLYLEENGERENLLGLTAQFVIKSQ